MVRAEPAEPDDITSLRPRRTGRPIDFIGSGADHAGAVTAAFAAAFDLGSPKREDVIALLRG